MLKDRGKRLRFAIKRSIIYPDGASRYEGILLGKKELQSEFTSFFEFFSDAANRIEKTYVKIPNFCDDAIILLCAYIDALGIFRFGGGRKGFIQFIENYSDDQIRQHYAKVSALFLDQPLLTANGEVAGKLKRNKIKRIRERLYGNNKTYDSLTETDRSTAIKKLRRFKDISKYIDRFTYSSYFYHNYRCFGVHNAQLPGFNNSRDRDPFYIATTDLDTGRVVKWNLVFPINFVINTLKSCIENFRHEIETNITGRKNLSNKINKYKFVMKEFSVKNEFFTNFLRYRKIRKS